MGFAKFLSESDIKSDLDNINNVLSAHKASLRATKTEGKQLLKTAFSKITNIVSKDNISDVKNAKNLDQLQNAVYYAVIDWARANKDSLAPVSNYANIGKALALK